VVEQVDETRLNCRLVSRYALELEDAERESLIAIRAKSVHPHTDLVIHTATDEPLVGAGVWLESLDDSQQATRRMGTTDADGRVKLAAEQRCCWIRVQIGDQLLDRIPILPGHQSEQVWQTNVDDATLAVAQMFARCSEDLAVLEAQRRLYAARADARKQDDKDQHAQQLLAEMREVVSKQREQLELVFRRRRKALADRFPQAIADVDDRWSQLINALRKQ
jgi:hypothetical protein